MLGVRGVMNGVDFAASVLLGAQEAAADVRPLIARVAQLAVHVGDAVSAAQAGRTDVLTASLVDLVLAAHVVAVQAGVNLEEALTRELALEPAEWGWPGEPVLGEA